MADEDKLKEREVVISGKNVTGAVVSFMEEYALAPRFRESTVKVRLKRTACPTGLRGTYTVAVEIYDWPWKSDAEI